MALRFRRIEINLSGIENGLNNFNRVVVGSVMEFDWQLRCSHLWCGHIRWERKWNQDRPCTYKRNNEVLSRNSFCRGKALTITYFECVCSRSYPACKERAQYCIVVCDLSGSVTFFPHFLINGTIFGKRLNIKRVFWLFLQLCLKYFSVWRIQREIVTNAQVYSCSYSTCCVLVRFEWDMNFTDRLLKKYSLEILWKSV